MSRRLTRRTLVVLVTLAASSAGIVLPGSTSSRLAAPSNLNPAAGVYAATSAPAAPAAPAGCRVSARLVPSCGAWLGASTASKDGTFNYATGLAEYEAIAANPPDILHFYKRNAATFPTAAEVTMSRRPGKPASMLFYNWKPSTTKTWSQIATGQADAAITTVAAGLVAYGERLFLTIHHEPEDEVNATAGSGYTTADYVNMYRYVANALRAKGATNVVFVMNYMGFFRWASIIPSLYPGDDVVDWIAYDPYGFAADTSIAAILNQTAAGWPGFYQWATATHPSKPLMLAEFGIDVPKQPAAASILATLPTVLASDFPAIRAVVYWNDTVVGGVRPRIDETVAYGNTYATVAAAPYFTATLPPVWGNGLMRGADPILPAVRVSPPTTRP